MIHQTEIYLDQCIKAFCTVHLNNEYYSLCIDLKVRLVKNGTITFREKNIKIWAAAIVYAICYLNDLLPKYISSKLIHDFFGFTAIDVSNRAYAIVNGIYHKYEYWANDNQNFENEYYNEQDFTENQSNSYRESKKGDKQKNENANSEFSTEYINYCNIMKLEVGFTKMQLKNQYRELMKTYHPDLQQNKSRENIRIAENKSKEINIAYEYLNKYINS